MARLPRLVLAGRPHLVIQRALDGRAAFVDGADRAHLLDVLREAIALERVQMHAYALLEHELLLLATPAEPASLARLMQAIGRRYVSAYNRRHGRRGTLWEGRFRACPVEPGAPALEAMVWIETQAGAAALAASATAAAPATPATPATPASSASHHIGALRSAMLTDPPEYWGLGNTPFEREHAWRELLARGLGAEAAARLRRTALGGWALGSPAFVAAAASAGRPAAPRPRGRPRRTPSTR